VVTATPGKAKVPEAAINAPHGSKIIFDTDYFGKRRGRKLISAGPFTDLERGGMVLKVWQESK
jgi:hypothetical protein